MIFQRLHGSGIAFVRSKKIVELHGGEICLEFELNQGAAFYLILRE